MPPFHDPNRLERHIYFYRIGLFTPGRTASAAQAFDPTPFLDRLPAVLATDDRYLETGDRVTCCFPDSGSVRPRVRVANIRRSALPQVESGGVLTPLAIDERSGLAEQIHVAFFDQDVVGAEFNFYGPRPWRLAEYLHRKCGAPLLTIEPLLRPDVMALLDQLEDVRIMTLRIRRDTIDDVRLVDESLGAAFARTAQWAPDMEIVLRKQPHAREPLPERVLGAVRRLAGSEEVRRGARTFRVTGRRSDTGDISVVDILKSDLVATRRILRAGPRQRTLDSADAYAAIEDAYVELRDEIGAALPVRE